ncbi:NUDIX domain-containing protein [Nocardia sp. NPDC006630]|uniref:NUDIX hydrolase n=1 Tax=Nocardia sp. NPDC006630 TaxID=3157181 RepID=UPI0033B6F3AB
MQSYRSMWGESTAATDAQAAYGRAGTALFDRKPDGHVTCSTMIINPIARTMLLTLHHKYRTWQQFGGHPEGEQKPILAARREAQEESGLTDLKFFPTPIDVDIHDAECPPGCSNKHIDVCFAASTASIETRISTESDAIEWVTIDEAAELGVTDRVLLLGLLSFGLAGIQI